VLTGLKKPAGVILAGGRSSRMGGTHKALLDLNGRPLLSHVVDRLQNQLGPLLLSCESGNENFEKFGLPVVPDMLPGHRGPLAGLCSALQYVVDNGHDNGLVLCPCDAPFIPAELVQVLLDASQDENGPVVVVSYKGVLQPTFSLWQSHHLPVIRDMLFNKGIGGLKYLLKSLPHKTVEWAPAVPSPFFNINTPVELETAAKWLDRPQSKRG
jgi:molybdopterin-guanine dinucleotide biosynthesis protein A